MRRVVGIETEYGIAATGTQMSAEQAARILFTPTLEYSRTTNLFLENGGRLYLDVGAHPEYATAECDRLDDLVAQDLAGAQILRNLADQALAAGVNLRLYKNNLDSQGNSFGCHENYLLHRKRDFRDLADSLIAFLVTRQIIVGAGGVHAGRYVYSVRSHYVWDAISGATTRARPIINTRDEPLADAGEYRRMHVIVGDSNIAGATTRLKIAMTLALLDAIEERAEIPAVKLADPMAAIRAIAFDAHAPIDLASGGQTTAWQLQSDFHAHLGQYCEPQMHQLWGETLHAIETGRSESIVTRIDWAAKRALIDHRIARAGGELALDDPIIAATILAYHDISQAGLGWRMVGASRLENTVTQAQIDQAMQNPPATTRAALRGAVIAAARAARREVTADWNHIHLNEPNNQVITLGDPFATSDSRIDELITRLGQDPADVHGFGWC